MTKHVMIQNTDAVSDAEDHIEEMEAQTMQSEENAQSFRMQAKTGEGGGGRGRGVQQQQQVSLRYVLWFYILPVY